MCDICNGHPNCPVCQTSTTLEKSCPECEGKGHYYYDFDGSEITKDHYDKLHENEREKYSCDICDGEGVIEYEPEYEIDYYG